MRKLRSHTTQAGLLFIILSFLTTCVVPPAAWAAPLIAITSPTDGGSVVGDTYIDVSYRGDRGLPVTSLLLFVDGKQVQEVKLPKPLAEGKYTFKWQFDLGTQEAKIVSVRAVDAQGGEGYATITVRLQEARVERPGGAADKLPPVVRIFYPAHGAKVHGKLTVKAEAEDANGVSEVFFYIDGKLHRMLLNAPPWVDEWDTTKLPDGQHLLQAAAWDPSDNEGRSTEVMVFVDNKSLTTGEAPLPGATTIEIPTFDPGVGTTTPARPVSPPPPSAAVLPPGVPVVAPLGTAAAPPLTGVQPAPRVTTPTGGSRTTAYGASRGSGPGLTATGTPVAAAPQPPVVSVPGLPGASGDVAVISYEGSPSLIALIPPGEQPLPSGTRVSLPGRMIATAPRPATPATRPQPRPAVAPAPGLSGPALATTVLPGGPRLTGEPSLGGDLLLLAKPRYGAPDLLSAPVRTATPGGAPGTVAVLPATAPPASVPVTVPAGERPRATLAPGEGAQPSGAALTTAALLGPAGARTTTPPATTAPASAPQPAAGATVAMLPKPVAPAATPLVAPAATTPTPVPAAVAQIRDISIIFDGEKLDLSALPELRQGVSLGPLREIFQRTDGTLYWFPVEKRVRAVNGEVDLQLTIGSKAAKVNQETRTLELAPFIKQGRTMVPLQFIAETLKVTITYNQASGQVVISSTEF